MVASAAPIVDDLSTLGGRLRWLRVRAGVAMQELDRLAGRTPGHARKIEHNPATPIYTDVAADYARALGVSLDWLVRGAGATPRAAHVRAAIAQARARARGEAA